MAKEKINRGDFDTMRSYLSKKKNTKINLDDYEVYEPVSHNSNDNEDMKRALKIKQNKKNTIRLTESELKRVISESVKRVLEENKYLNKVLIIIRDKNEEPVFCKEIPYDDYEQYYSDWKRCCVNGAFITVEDDSDYGYLKSSKNDNKGVEFFGDPDHPSHYGETTSKIYGI